MPSMTNQLTSVSIDPNTPNIKKMATITDTVLGSLIRISKNDTSGFIIKARSTAIRNGKVKVNTTEIKYQLNISTMISKSKRMI